MDFAPETIRFGQDEHEVRATVLPERGALISQFSVQGREVFYLDEATVADPSRSVRGGIPILFPFAGALKDDHLVWSKTTIQQHGFGRNQRWKVTQREADALTVAFSDDAQTFAVFPYRFWAEQRVSVSHQTLSVVLSVRNTGAEPMPLAPGWHPYFACPSEQKSEIESDVESLDSARFTPNETFDFGIAAPASARFVLPQLGPLQLGWSSNMRFLQFWSQPQKDFICIEPFLGPPNAINGPAGDRLLPGAVHEYRMTIRCPAP